MLLTTIDALTEAEIVRRLAAAQNDPLDNPYPAFAFIESGPPRPAAVLIPMLRQAEAWHILFTRRNSELAEHSGQVAFPGGRSDPEDASPEQTALREAHEEIGLEPSDVRILGRLKQFLTITNYQVTPIVGVIPWPYPIHLATEEVSRAFTIPLSWLLEPSNHEIRQRSLSPPYSPISVIHFLPYDGEILWGASARFILALLETLREG